MQIAAIATLGTCVGLANASTLEPHTLATVKVQPLGVTGPSTSIALETDGSFSATENQDGLSATMDVHVRNNHVIITTTNSFGTATRIIDVSDLEDFMR